MNKKLKILIVEDDGTSAHYLLIYLNTLGYEICGKARSGEDAIIIANKENPNVVIMDICLEGDMNGIETARKMLEKDRNISIIFVSTKIDPDIFKHAMALDPVSFLTKPVDPAMLKSSLDSIKNFDVYKNIITFAGDDEPTETQII
ncbi:MAG: two component signal transduction response regulator [uncultured bacterium]|nr:MAG: two component signal transduction response regulator [uncultured bacterium]